MRLSLIECSSGIAGNARSRGIGERDDPEMAKATSCACFGISGRIRSAVRDLKLGFELVGFELDCAGEMRGLRLILQGFRPFSS